MEQDPTRMCALLVGLPDVDVLGVELNVPIRVHVETAGERPVCREGTVALSHNMAVRDPWGPRSPFERI